MTLPRNYAEWHDCITVSCRIALTPAYIEARLAELKRPSADEIRRFTELYGKAHLERVVSWFERARREVPVLDA